MVKRPAEIDVRVQTDEIFYVFMILQAHRTKCFNMNYLISLDER